MGFGLIKEQARLPTSLTTYMYTHPNIGHKGGIIINMTKIRVTIDLNKADDSMSEHLSEQSMELGTHGCDKDGAYHMYYHSRTNLIEFEDVQIECPNCLHGWRRDVGPNGDDEECFTCDTTGFVSE